METLHLPMSAVLGILALSCLGPPCRAREADGQIPVANAAFFLSPSGEDADPGTQAKPFRTLERARDAVRDLRKDGANGDITVILRGGTYRIQRTVVFGLQDSAPDGARTRFAAFPGETPVLSGAASVRGWERLEGMPDHLPEEARGKIWVANVRDILDRKIPQEPPVPPEAAEPVVGELLSNGDFSAGIKNWEVYAANRETEKLAVKLQTTDAGPAVELRVISGRAGHHLQFRQAVEVTKGAAYVWRFTLSADAETTIPVHLLQGSPPHQTVIHADIKAGLEPRVWELRGVAPETLSCVASFQVGGNVGRRITIGGVSLTGPRPSNAYARRPSFETAGRFFTLFEGADRLPRARSRGFRQTNAASGWHAGSHHDLHYPPRALRDGPDVGDAEIVTIPRAQWIQNLLPLMSVNESTCTARMRYPATYAMAYCGAGHAETVWVENRLEHLDAPGEWVLDSRAGRLYLWPSGDTPEDVSAPLLTELVRLEGSIDEAGPTDIPVHGLEFVGITFTHAERYSWHGLSGWGLQHDWEAFDAPSAMVRLRGTEACALIDCRFVAAGSTGLRLDLHARHNVVRGCRFSHLGGVGVLLAGYGPGAKNVNRQNEITDNDIHHIGETYWASPAVFVWQSGENRIAHNTIRDTPYTGIVVSARAGLAPRPGTGECSATIRNHEINDAQRGDWDAREPLLHGRLNTIEYNDIFRVMQRLGDGNGIYVSGTGRGNRVQYNYVHNCPSPHLAEGIRCDDDQHDTIIHGNVVWGLGGHATGITIKGRNTITNNIVGAPFVPRTARGFLSLELGSMKGSVIQRNVLFATRRGHAFVYQRRLYGSGPTPRLRDAAADSNLYWCEEEPARAEAFLTSERAHGVELNSRVANPGFVDTGKGDFRFVPGSPALALGVNPVDVRVCGLRSPYRERYIKPPVTACIEPHGGLLTHPIRVALTASEAGARIRYTTNGTLPTHRSTLYAEPFELTKACSLRARAFKEGFEDENGTTALFLPPPDPLRIAPSTLNSLESTAQMRVHEDKGGTFGIELAPEKTGGKVLRFTDGPGQTYSFDPHLEIPFTMKAGRLRGSTTLRVDAATHLYCQWRRHGSPLKAGPTFHIRPGGRLMLEGGRELMRVPLGTWLRIEMEGEFGVDSAARFSLRVRQDATDAVREFHDLPTPSADFRWMNSLFIVAQGTEKAVFDIREIELVPVEAESARGPNAPQP